MPKVSVIILTYNRSALLRRAVQSVLNQTFGDFEVIVVDDASVDDTKDVIKDMTDKRIRYLPHEQNMGEGRARNTGVANAQGEYIAFLDDDDEWLPEKLELQVSVMEKSEPGIGAVHTGYWRILTDTGEVRESDARKEGDLWGEFLFGNNLVHPSSILLRASCFERLGVFDVSITTGLDYDMWLRVSKEYKFAAINKPLLKVREHGDRLSSNLELQIQGQTKFFEKWGKWIEADEKNYSRWFVRLGIMYSLTGQQNEGRKAYMKAMRRYPLHFKSYALLSLSLLGTKAFRSVTKFNESVRLCWLRDWRGGNNKQI